MPADITILLGAVIALGFVATAISERTRVPDLLFLVPCGVAVGRALDLDPSGASPAFMSGFGVVALSVVLFRTGLSLDLRQGGTRVVRALVLALASFSLSLLLTYSALTLGLGMEGPRAWAIAATLACTSAGLTLPALARFGVGIEGSALVAVESALTEAMAVFLVLALVEPRGSGTEGVGAWGQRGLAFLLGGGAALVAGLVWMALLRHLARRSHVYLLTLGLVFLMMGLVQWAGGSGSFAVLVFGAMLANSQALLARARPALGPAASLLGETGTIRSSIEDSHSQLYFFIRACFFIYLGALLGWPGSDLATWLAILLVGTALVAARVAAVGLSGWLTGQPGRERRALVAATPRGLTSAVLITIVLPWAGPGPWVTVAIAGIVLTNLWMWAGMRGLTRTPGTTTEGG